MGNYFNILQKTFSPLATAILLGFAGAQFAYAQDDSTDLDEVTMEVAEEATENGTPISMLARDIILDLKVIA